MFPIAIAAGLAGTALAVARLAGWIDLPPYVFILTLVAAAMAWLSRSTSTLIRAIIGFLVVWHLSALAILLLNEAGRMPEALGPYLPTRASILLSVIFAIAVYALSFVGTIRQITKLADPFFETRDEGVIHLPFGRSIRMQERYIAHALLYILLAINVAQVLATVLLNQWNNRFYTALQQRAEATFWVELQYFTIVAFLWVILAVYELYLTQYTQMRWRRWLTRTVSRATGWTAAATTASSLAGDSGRQRRPAHRRGHPACSPRYTHGAPAPLLLGDPVATLMLVPVHPLEPVGASCQADSRCWVSTSSRSPAIMVWAAL